MAGGKLVALEGGASEAKRACLKEPLGEAPAKDLDRFPIWVHIGSADHARGIFKFLQDELDRAGFRCAGDLQTDPHDGLKIESFFEIFLHVGQKRAPENFGIVTLFSDQDGNLAIKMNPAFPAACNLYRKALTEAIERQLGAATKKGAIDADIAIRQQSEYEPLPARVSDMAPNRA
ncbi:hypothetical protein L0Y65_00135 [Candidatus Micrarchaeota archaeon]|nr:hypothetical protein [Candidatus Micrarchaeota archaeon]